MVKPTQIIQPFRLANGIFLLWNFLMSSNVRTESQNESFTLKDFVILQIQACYLIK